MRIFLYFLFIFLLTACGSTKSPEQKAVDTALAAYKKNPADSTAQSVVLAMDQYIEKTGYADSTSARYVLQSARISAEHQQFSQAIDYYKTYMVQYPERPDQATRLTDVIALTEKLHKPELDQILYKSFVYRFPEDARANDLTSKIENKDLAVDSMLRFIGMNMFNDSTFRLNEERARLYIDACELAVMANSTLPNAAEHLHRAAETGRTLRDIPKAIELYDWIIDKFPTHQRAATSLFLKAFTYDNDLKDFDRAGKLYNEYLAKFPQGEYAESARFLIDNLGKSEEELIKILEKSKENVQ